LLTHSSGLPYHTYTNLVEADRSLAEIAGMLQEVELIAKPGMIYSYQNVAFALAGPIMEAASGKPTEELLETYLFRPLQMERASASLVAMAKDSNVAQPHKGNGPLSQPQPLKSAFYNAVLAGGINASISDMAYWMQFLLKGHPEILSKENLDEIVFQPRVDTRVRNRYFQQWGEGAESWYGLGWRIHLTPDTTTGMIDKLYHHGGAVNGFRSEIALYPEDQIGICVLFNSHSRLAARVIPEVFRRIEEPYRALRAWYPLP
jgi:beta-lactamase class C